jgi:hypothetical protein
MLVQPHEIKELTKCFYCDCATDKTGVCTWHGEPCKECFDVTTYQHYQVDPNHPGLFTQSTARNELRRIEHPRISEIPTDPNGDCLYDCVSKALGGVPISDLRAFVSRSQTQDTFEAYRTISRNSPGYDVLQKVRTLRGLKNTIQRCGSTVGSNECLWGDENAIQILSNGYLLRFAVFDTTGKMIQNVEPEPLGTPSKTPSRTVLLRLNRSTAGSEHFTLLTFNRQTLLQAHEWLWLSQQLRLV